MDRPWFVHGLYSPRFNAIRSWLHSHAHGTELLLLRTPIQQHTYHVSVAFASYIDSVHTLYRCLRSIYIYWRYTFERQVFVFTDHKPLVAISSKMLSKAPERLKTLPKRAQKYTFDLSWSPGTEIPVTDVLSRAPVQQPSKEELVHCVTENE